MDNFVTFVQKSLGTVFRETSEMLEHAQLKAEVPRRLKHQLYVALACREETFAHWLRSQMERWLRETDLPSDITNLDRKAINVNNSKAADGMAEAPCEHIG
jgi:hypothetical protein